MNLTACPECDLTAEVVDSFDFHDAQGPLLLVRTRCLYGHVRDTPHPTSAID